MECATCGNLNLGQVMEPHPLPAASLLYSHTVATEIDTQNAKRAILHINAQISQLDESGARLDKLIEMLTQERCRLLDERRSLVTSLEGHYCIIAPIRRVSDDILSEIFIACLPVGQPDLCPTQNPSKKAPCIATILVGVCSRWRAVALSTAHLWTRINFEAISSFEAVANLFELFVSRSGVCPLRIEAMVHLASGYSDASDDGPDRSAGIGIYGMTKNVQSLINVLAASVHRWQHVHIVCSRLFLRQLELAVGPSCLLPLLERLEIQFRGDGWSELSQLRIFAKAPRLRHCSMTDGRDLDCLFLPWDQIESWTWRGRFSIPYFVTLLSKCPNLKRCNVARDPSSRFEIQSTPMRHDLISLQIPFEDPSYFEAFFGSFDMPSLLDLRVSFGGFGVWSQPHFSNFLSRSSCTLQRLVLDSMAVSGKDFLLILCNAPSLTGFELTERYYAIALFNTHVVERLTFIPENPIPLLPNLCTLSLLGYLDFDTCALAKMVASRNTHNTAHPPALQSVFLHYLRGAEVAKMTEALREVQDLLGERADIRSIETLSSQSPAFPELL